MMNGAEFSTLGVPGAGPGGDPPAAVAVIGRRGLRGPVVRDVFDWPGFDVELVTGEDALDRPIRVAHATDLVDPRKFLRGDELIMTVGSELVDDAACERFVRNVVESGAAAIALAVGVDGHEPPAGLAPAAGRAGIAMFTVPPTLPFVAFTEKLQELADERGELERVRHEDGRMLDYVRRGYASAQIFRSRFPQVSGAKYVALCLPAYTSAEVEGVIVEGWIDDVTIVVVDELFVRGFAERAAETVYGIGSPVPQRDLARTVKEAMATFSMSARRGVGAGPRDLSTFTGLVDRLTPEQLAPFRDNIVDPLCRYDARYGRALWPTLRAYIESGASVSTTADRLRVHANSVRNRLARVHEITGLDPAIVEDRFALAVAVRGV